MLADVVDIVEVKNDNLPLLIIIERPVVGIIP